MTSNRLPLTRDGTPRAFFGRRSGKRLHAGQRELLDTLLPALRIEGEAIDPETLFPGAERIVLEIGYGGGEHLSRLARENPGTGFIGAEVFSGGIGKLLAAIEAEELDNIRLYTEDALHLLRALPGASIDTAHLLYPDPWPKTRHHKRRFVSALTLSELVRVLKPGGRLYVATDIEDYANWTLAHALCTRGLRFIPGAPGSWHDAFPGWQPTRYEEKARREGRALSFYLTFERE